MISLKYTKKIIEWVLFKVIEGLFIKYIHMVYLTYISRISNSFHLG